MPERRVISVKFDEAVVDRLDALAQVLSARAAGAEITRSAVARMAIERGIPVLEEEVGAPPPDLGEATK